MNDFTNTGLTYKPAIIWKKRDLFYFIFYWRPSVEYPFKRYKKSFDVNRIDLKPQRALAAHIMWATLNECLANGWNPETEKLPGSDLVDDIQAGTLEEFINFAHKSIIRKTSKQRTVNTYNSHRQLFEDYLKNERGIYHSSFEALTPVEAERYQAWLIKRAYSPKTINTKIEYASGLFAVLVKKRMVQHNPFIGVDKMKETESDVHKLFTEQEINKIKEYTLTHAPELWQYALLIYYCFMRPESIMHIKVQDIDVEACTLLVSGENHKNGETVVKQLLTPHLKYLKPYIEHLRKDQYLFSKDMLPGSVKQAPTRAAETWKLHIKESLKINKNAYGLKATGAARFVTNNAGSENLKWLQTQLAHSDLQTTSIYTNKLKTVMLDESKTVLDQL